MAASGAPKSQRFDLSIQVCVTLLKVKQSKLLDGTSARGGDSASESGLHASRRQSCLPHKGNSDTGQLPKLRKI
eukprot:1960164-Amphidinium_carterae.1